MQSSIRIKIHEMEQGFLRCLKSGAMKRSIHQQFVGLLALVSLLLFPASTTAQYAVGDYGSITSGDWTTVATWGVWNGTIWTTAAAVPGPTNNVHVLSGRTVVLDGSGQNFIIRNLVVETGGKLWTDNDPVNNYITIRGPQLRCDGQIGDGATFDGISFNFDGAATLLFGTGTFDASRLRKFSSANAVPMNAYQTDLTIDMDIRLRFNSASTTQIYNNQDNTCVFNVTINTGRTVELTGAVGSGNVAIDGIDGLSNHARGGTVTVNGTLLIPGALYLTSNNVNGTPKCRFIINNGGYVRTTNIMATASGTAVHDLIVNDGGTLEITGTPAWNGWSVTNNTYTFGNASTTIYSAMAGQDVRPVPGGYGHLTVRGIGVKALSGGTEAKGNVTILNTDGAPELDVTATNHQLTVRGDWTSYGLAGFNERTGLVIFSQGAAQTVNTTGGERFHNWRIEKTGTVYVTMASDVAIVNNLNLSGTTANARLDLGGRQLTLLNPAAAAITGTFNANRHIRAERQDHTSRVRWDIGATTGAHQIPFGGVASVGAANGLRMFNFNLTAGNAGQVTVSSYGTLADNLAWPTAPTVVTNLNSLTGLLPDNRAATVDRFWEIGVTGTPTATLTFNYVAAELPLAPYNTAAAMRAQRWDPAVQTWLPALGAQAAGNYFVTVPGVTAFGAFALAPGSNPLPIELLVFGAEPNGAVVDLEWATGSERDNAFFTILRSSDVERFEEVLRVPAVGESSARIDYTAVDGMPLSGLSYYKLRQTDNDGTYTESQVVTVYFKTFQGDVHAWPNPVEDHVWIAGLPEAEGMVHVVDMMGRSVRRVFKPGGDAPLMIALDGLSAGRYMVVAESASWRSVSLLKR